MPRTFLLPDNIPSSSETSPDHWMRHWRQPGGEIVHGGAPAHERALAQRLQDAGQSRIVAEGRRILDVASLCERRLDLSVAAAVFVVSLSGADKTAADFDRRADDLWFAPLAFRAIVALPQELPAPLRAMFVRAAADWRARVVTLDRAAQPQDGRPWTRGEALLAEARAAVRAPRRQLPPSLQPIRFEAILP
jgi:hypothetical protein